MTAIEGNTLIQSEVEDLLERGIARGNRALVEYMEVKGYADAADWVYQQASSSPQRSEAEPLLTLADVRMIHKTKSQLACSTGFIPKSPISFSGNPYRDYPSHDCNGHKAVADSQYDPSRPSP